MSLWVRVSEGGLSVNEKLFRCARKSRRATLALLGRTKSLAALHAILTGKRAKTLTSYRESRVSPYAVLCLTVMAQMGYLMHVKLTSQTFKCC